MVFNGSGADEIFEAFTMAADTVNRNVDNIVMDSDDVEVVDLEHGADTLTVNDNAIQFDTDLAGTSRRHHRRRPN